MHTYMHTYIHTYTHTYIHTYITHIPTYIHDNLYTCFLVQKRFLAAREKDTDADNQAGSDIKVT
jgi:hypothetical protein